MTVSITEAATIGLALIDAAKACPVRQLRIELEERADEWVRAAKMAQDFSDDQFTDVEVTIDMLDSVVKGMRVMDYRHGAMRVKRKLNNGLTLHLDNPDDPRGIYLDFYTGTSPVCVKL